MLNPYEGLIDRAKATIPSVDSILQSATARLSYSADDIRQGFGEALVKIDEAATEIYKEHERNALVTLAKGWLEAHKEEIKAELIELAGEGDWDAFIDRASALFVEFSALVQRLEKDLGNKRKARGGATFQKAILALLNHIGISAENPKGKGAKQLRMVDIVVPSVQVALETPDRAFFLSCKRTLRERWKQSVPEGGAQRRIYLVTIDDELSESKAEEIGELGFIAFVRDAIAEELGKPWIRRLSELPDELRGR